jgi:uncharacterized OsmC-like protein
MNKIKKINANVVVALMILMMSGCSTNKKEPTSPLIEYKVQSRIDKNPEPSSFLPSKAHYAEGSFSENVVVVTQRVLNKDSFMLKKALVKPVADDGFSAWQLLCDEGGMTYEQSSPNPLSYLTTGIASSLLTQVQHSAETMNLDIDDIKVEAKVFFRFNDLMSDKWAGYTDKVIANILIQSKESPEKISKLKQLALNSWTVGEGLANKTDIETELVVNAEHWNTKASSGGSVPNPISVDNNMTITSKTSAIKPTTFEVGEDVGITPMSLFSNKIEFAVVAIAQPAGDMQRPYLQKIKVRAIQDNYAAWTLYSDDSYGHEGLDKAPTSLDYVTAGTALCLMSQLDINQEFFRLINRRFEKFDIEDYRVEQQINYRQEEIDSLKTNGFVDKVITKIVVNSKASKEDLKTFFNTSLQMCFAGEAFKNETEIDSNVYLNGKVIK